MSKDKKKAKASQPGLFVGGCYIIIGPDGVYWDGCGWTKDRSKAKEYPAQSRHHGEMGKTLAQLRLAGQHCCSTYLPVAVGRN